jgi:hypothetical protein
MRKKTIEKISQTEPSLTWKRTSNVATPPDKETEVASRRRRKVYASEEQRVPVEDRDKEGGVRHTRLPSIFHWQ